LYGIELAAALSALAEHSSIDPESIYGPMILWAV
jgi:hypothetical protein